MPFQTPYYLIDEARMAPAMETIRYVQERSGVRCLLALKCFSAFAAFPFMRCSMAGTTSSGLYEARLGYEEFGGETHGYCVAYDAHEIEELVGYCDKVIFNSLGQLERFGQLVIPAARGIRLNPGFGRSSHALSDPVRQYSRLGVRAEQLPPDLAGRIGGVMTHVNCDNDDVDSVCAQLDRLERDFAALLPSLRWVSLGGGIAFTDHDYPVDTLCDRLRAFSERNDVALYLEPGEAAVRGSTALVVTVLDIVHNEVPTLIVDAGVEPHLLDVMTYDYTPELEGARALDKHSRSLAALDEPHVYRVAGRTCLAGDHFGNYAFGAPVVVGQRLRFPDVGGYSMVKKNFFNGIRMPSIVHRPLGEAPRIVQRPTYESFRETHGPSRSGERPWRSLPSTESSRHREA